MDTDTQAAEGSVVDGGTPTTEEARLAAELAAEHAPKPAGDAAAAAAETPAAAESAAAAASDAPAAAAAGEAAPTPAPTPAPDPAPTKPVAPRDFDAAYAENQQKFDDGEIDADEFQKTFRGISKEEAAFTARVEIFNERQQSAEQRAAAAFNQVALDWEAKNKAFVENPLYLRSMQEALEATAKQNPNLTPAELFARAEKAAFEFTKYTPPAAAADAGRTAVAAATAARAPSRVPTTLGSAPTAALLDGPTGGGAFSKLDGMDIDNLENQLARMSPDQVEAYLADAPGAKATGH